VKALHSLCPAPERLVDYVLDGPCDEISSHIGECLECSREVIDLFKRFDQWSSLEREEEGAALPGALWDALHLGHRPARDAVVLSMRLQPKPSFVDSGRGEDLREAAVAGLRGGDEEEGQTVAELAINGGLRLVFVIVEGVLTVRALREGAPQQGVRLVLEGSAAGEAEEPAAAGEQAIGLTIATDESGRARIELAPFAGCRGVAIRLGSTSLE